MGTTAANVEVTVGSPSGANQAVSGATGTWETAQTVTAAIEDPADTAAIAHTVGGYSGVTSAPIVTVHEVEDLTPTLGAVAAQTYRAGQRVNVRLPGATGATRCCATR